MLLAFLSFFNSANNAFASSGDQVFSAPMTYDAPTDELPGESSSAAVEEDETEDFLCSSTVIFVCYQVVQNVLFDETIGLQAFNPLVLHKPPERSIV